MAEIKMDENWTFESLMNDGKLAQMDYDSQMHSERAEGRAEGRAEDARRMKMKGYSVEDISDITGLSENEIAML